MDDSPHSTSARATINSTVLILTRDSFKELMKEQNETALQYSPVLEE